MRHVLDIKEPGADIGFAMKDFPELDHVPQIGCTVFPETKGEQNDIVMATVVEVQYMLTDVWIKIICELASSDDVDAFTKEKGWRLTE